jgi:hypothetical protein
MTVTDMCQALGISPDRARRMENGEVPIQRSIALAAGALSAMVQPIDFDAIGEAEEKSPNAQK